MNYLGGDTMEHWQGVRVKTSTPHDSFALERNTIRYRPGG